MIESVPINHESSSNDFQYKILYIVNTSKFIQKKEMLENIDLFEKKEYFKNSFCFLYYIHDKLYIKEEHNEWVIEINQNEYKIYISECNPLYKIYLLRFLRYISYGLCEDKGMILMHGAAVSYQGNGIIIVGEKGSGKTTLLINFLNMKADLIANDRLFITDELNIIGVPQALRIGCDSFNNESKIQEYFKRNNLFREQEKIKTDNFKYLLVVSELIKIYKCKFRIQKHLDYILIPDIQIGKNDVEIECLDEIEKERIFEKVCFTPFDESFRSDWICFTSNNILNKIRFRRERWHDIRELQFVKVKYGTEVEAEFITSRIMEFLNESKGENVYV